MRVRLQENSLAGLFDKIHNKYATLTSLAFRIDVNPRTLKDWEQGKTTIPFTSFKKLVKLASIPQNSVIFTKLPDFWHIQTAARKGAYKRQELYGNPGTFEGRKLGGINSIKIHKILKNKFKTLKTIRKPINSKKLAELMGILIGDGHLSDYQVSVTTNSETDMAHAIFVKKLIAKFFKIPVSIKTKNTERTVTVIGSSKNLVQFLNQKGMPIGNKIQNNLCIPAWINRNKSYKRAFIRGLFDTDGCIYVDIHKGKNKTYKHFGWTITSYADILLSDVIQALKELGFTPTNRKTQKSVYLRRQKEIIKYFKEIGTSNPKHYMRYFGRVPKWS